MKTLDDRFAVGFGVPASGEELRRNALQPALHVLGVIVGACPVGAALRLHATHLQGSHHGEAENGRGSENRLLLREMRKFPGGRVEEVPGPERPRQQGAGVPQGDPERISRNGIGLPPEDEVPVAGNLSDQRTRETVSLRDTAEEGVEDLIGLTRLEHLLGEPVVRQQILLGIGDLLKSALDALPDRPLLLLRLEAATRQKAVDGPGDIPGRGLGRKDLALLLDGFRDRRQRGLRGQDEALAKEGEDGRVEEEEGGEGGLRQERQPGSRVRDERLQGPLPGVRPAHHRRLTLEPGSRIAEDGKPVGFAEQRPPFRIDDPAMDSPAPEVHEVSVDVREGYRPDGVAPIPLRSAVEEDTERENAPAVRKIPGRPHEDGQSLPRPGPDALEVPFGRQIGDDGHRVDVPLDRRVPSRPPPLLHRGGEPEDLPPQVGADLGGDERAFARDHVLRKVRAQGADGGDSAHQVREEDGEQEIIPPPDTYPFRFHHDG